MNSYLCFGEGDPTQTGLKLSLKLLQAESLLPVYTHAIVSYFRFPRLNSLCDFKIIKNCYNKTEVGVCWILSYSAAEIKSCVPGLCKCEVLVPTAVDYKSYQCTSARRWSQLIVYCCPTLGRDAVTNKLWGAEAMSLKLCKVILQSKTCKCLTCLRSLTAWSGGTSAERLRQWWL